MKLTVVGMGYLGLTHAAVMAELGHEVLGVDIDQERIDQLNAASVPFYEPGLPEILERVRSRGRLHFTTSLQAAASFSDVHFIAVGTPERNGDHAADLRDVEAVIDNLVPQLSSDAVIFGRSTVPVGTTAALTKRAAALAATGITVDIAWNPEFIREGHAIADTLHPDRIVLGTNDSAVEKLAATIYAAAIDAGTPFLTMRPQEAELVKVSANAFLATKISFINAVAQVCEASNADVDVVANAVGLDTRIGREFLRAGIGFGGGCLPKDIRAFAARCDELGATDMYRLLTEIDRINVGRRHRMLDVVRRALGDELIGAKIAILGCAFKPDSDDVRDSPALHIAEELQSHGAAVVVHDPRAIPNVTKLSPTLETAGTVEDACTGVDVVMVLTDWRQFRDLDPTVLASVTRQRILVDGRHALPADLWIESGWTYLT